ncbi:nucleotide sugar dehydrogenase [Aidingimonas halophila]|uniref:UDP-glucose 6-dehydrogenase n=1 Tax=Aidingimonas halophila TaxID=574349 RepID=A0A1H3BNS1_9GAMM|nr:nucleotide sugar dehydrogenase [Aidingimonas halophila]GHC26890.1 UDP-glucose 6-dehydrogenase [Aidingimonas halophila]SDX43642.1 UDPglucose 6-dehydrogenase [Aidingimonas halophila]
MRVLVHGSELSSATAAAALASVGHQVSWYPYPESPWSTLRDSGWLQREPGLVEQIESSARTRSLNIVESLSEEPTDYDILWIALAPDQRAAAQTCVRHVANHQQSPLIVVNNSTFPVGDTENLEQALGHEGQVAVSLPDMIEEGRAWHIFTRPERWLLGCEDAKAENQIRELLRAFNRRADVFQCMSRRAAELTKLAVNGMLATRISYMNEVAGLADSLGVDVEQVRQGMGADSRIGYEYLYPGCGFGGPNFSRDLMRLADVQSASGRDSVLLERVLDINEHKKETLFRKLWAHFHGQLKGRTVAIWGAAFKPGTARIDHAPVLTLLKALWAQDVHVRVHDPAALPALLEQVGEHPLLTGFNGDPLEACKGADALLLVTEWKQYWNPDWRQLRDALKECLVLDGRNIYDPTYVAARGLTYRGIGRRADP